MFAVVTDEVISPCLTWSMMSVEDIDVGSENREQVEKNPDKKRTQSEEAKQNRCALKSTGGVTMKMAVMIKGSSQTIEGSETCWILFTYRY